MAMRSLATRMWSPAASALRRRPRFVDTIHGQNGHATRKFSSDTDESAQAIIENAKKIIGSNKQFEEALKNSQIHEMDFELGYFSRRRCSGCGKGY